MLMNNGVDLNNVMMIWGELNVLMKKWIIEAKNNVALWKINMVAELGWRKAM